MTGGTFVARIDPELLAYVILALRQQAKADDRNGRRPPRGVPELVAALASSASDGQLAPSLSPVPDPVHVEPVSARLVTYDTAADLLACSVRQVNRLVAAGDLATVKVGGAVRVALADIDRFVDTNRTIKQETTS